LAQRRAALGARGQLPRCGWMNERVPDSQKWTTLAPQRAAEKVKLAEKRRKAVETDN